MAQASKRILRFFTGTLLFILAAFPPPSTATASDSISNLMEKGSAHYQRGEFASAVDFWKTAADRAQREKAPEAALKALLSQAKALQALGHLDRALATLQTAAGVADRVRNPVEKARFHARLGDLYLAIGQPDQAMAFLEKGEDLATKAGSREALAGVLINTGVAHASRKDYVDAVAAWEECRYLLDRMAEAPALRSRLLINLARISVRLGDPQAAVEAVREALSGIGDRPDSHEKGRDLVSLGLLAMEGRQIWPDAADEMDPMALSALQRADAIATRLDDPELMALARSDLGRLYELRGRNAEAMTLTLSALFHAQQSGISPEIRYPLHWRAGRLHADAGDMDEAIRSYRLSVEALTPIRQELVAGYRDRHDLFQEKIRPVYLELARLLLEKASRKNGDARKALLEEGRDAMELLKTVELQEYFQDPCVSALETTTIKPEEMAPHTAVIYPIPFPDYLAILLMTRDAIELYTVPVAATELDRTVRRFRRRLQNSRGEGFEEDGRTLHDWLIRPMEPALAQRDIDTLVIAPDGVLRLIPFSTLYDGERFLVQKYAVGTVPAITLTTAGPADGASGGVLLEGLSEARQGFASLPSVKQELSTLHHLMGGTVLLDENFTLDNLTQAFDDADYDIVHMATHGVFGGGADETFLLTHNEKLTMDRLERIIDQTRRRGNQVDLLTLSACQTALGDEWAAFGLAGIAVKAGVSSAVATLWFADDEAAFRIMTEFYREFYQQKKPKAEALRLAQTRMIGDDRFHHPAFWGPFLLIGNWL